MTLAFDESFEALLLAEGFSPTHGARPMRRAVQRLLENPLSECILDGFAGDGETLDVSADGGTVVMRRANDGGTRTFTAEELGSGGSRRGDPTAAAAKTETPPRICPCRDSPRSDEEDFYSIRRLLDSGRARDVM